MFRQGSRSWSPLAGGSASSVVPAATSGTTSSPPQRTEEAKAIAAAQEATRATTGTAACATMLPPSSAAVRRPTNLEAAKAAPSPAAELRGHRPPPLRTGARMRARRSRPLGSLTPGEGPGRRATRRGPRRHQPRSARRDRRRRPPPRHQQAPQRTTRLGSLTDTTTDTGSNLPTATTASGDTGGNRGSSPSGSGSRRGRTPNPMRGRTLRGTLRRRTAASSRGGGKQLRPCRRTAPRAGTPRCLRASFQHRPPCLPRRGATAMSDL
mmetsp:Transcript_1737/g.4065  ORF Transcript_1737/g.4065 Transcript_1737/m.4065 type:complete len:267 (-) Transcript_1737:24-824(-)